MARQTTLNVSLTPTLQKYIHAKVRSGRYESASEVIRESLRALQEREQAADVYWADVRNKVQLARKQVAEGKTHDGEQAMNEILAELDAENTGSPKRGKRR
jgi:antitoxin ParD1/3/4